MNEKTANEDVAALTPIVADARQTTIAKKSLRSTLSEIFPAIKPKPA
jgi:hypothetical protein